MGPTGDLQGTLTGLIQKFMIYWWNGIWEAIGLVSYTHSCFLQEKQISESSKCRRPRNVCRTHLQEFPGNKWCDVLGKSVKELFWIQLKITLNLVSLVTQNFIENASGKKFNEQYMFKEIIQTGTRHDEFKEILKLDFRVHGKVPFLIPLKSWH